ncbi:MAG: hypothetical protein ACLQU1_36755 [Bryobacteraceae bacterium]
MIAINRTAIVVKPSQPFLDWLRRADPTSGDLSLEDLQRDPAVYLLPECENEEEVRENLQEVCGRIFEEQLDIWYRVPSSWPKRRGLDVFEHWSSGLPPPWSSISRTIRFSGRRCDTAHGAILCARRLTRQQVLKFSSSSQWDWLFPRECPILYRED